MIRFVCFRRAAFTSLVLLLFPVTLAAAANEDRLPVSFWWYYSAEPAGWRYWFKGDRKTWMEKYDNKESRFTIGESAFVEGCHGTNMLNDDQSISVFLPDDNCVNQDLLFHFTNTEGGPDWRLLGVMQQITYEGHPSPLAAPPSQIARHPAAQLWETITDSLDAPAPKNRKAYAVSRINMYAMFDAMLEQCGIKTDFLNRAIAAAKSCARSSEGKQAVALFEQTKNTLLRYWRIATKPDCVSTMAVQLNSDTKKVLDDMITKISKSCG